MVTESTGSPDPDTGAERKEKARASLPRFRRVPWEAWAGLLVVPLALAFPLIPTGTFMAASKQDMANRWRWAFAPSIVRAFPPGRDFDKAGFDAAVRDWVKPGTGEDRAIEMVREAGFEPMLPYPPVHGIRVFRWRYDADVYCRGAGYAIHIRFSDGRVAETNGFHLGPTICA